MEQKNNNAANILSIFGIIVLFGIIIFFIIFNATKNKEEDTPMFPVVTVAPTVTEQSTEELDEGLEDITTLLSSFVTDLTSYLICNNPKSATYSTPGLTSTSFKDMRALFNDKPSSIMYYTLYEEDYTNSTMLTKGNYLVVCNVSSNVGDKRLYVYVQTSIKNNKHYISNITYEIGDF